MSLHFPPLNKKHLSFRTLEGALGWLGILYYPILVFFLHTHCDASFLLTSLFFTLPLCFLLACIRSKAATAILMGLFMVLSGAETVMVLLFDNFIVAGNILAILHTNSHEGGDFIQSNLGLCWYFIPLLAIFLIALIRHSKQHLNWRMNLLGMCLSAVIAAGYVTYKQVFSYKGVLTWRFYIENRILNRPPYNALYQFRNAAIQLGQRRALANSDKTSFSAIGGGESEQREVYVLAIGESCRYDNFSLNGIYERETTPLLAQTENLLLFHNYYSAACLTMYSVPQILTRATPLTWDIQWKEHTLIEPFKEVGFSTYVISHKANLLSGEKYLSREADSLIIVYADSTIPQLIDSISEVHNKVLFVLEFLGNHSFYHNYTEEFDRYHPNINDATLAKSDSLYINAYDNTLLYTDYILSQIIRAIDKPDAQSGMIFVSDHGENITATGGGHGGDCRPKKQEYHVPFLLWTSEGWKQHHPEKYALCQERVQSPLNSDNIFYSMCDMADIRLFTNDTTSADYQLQHRLSVFSPQWQAHKRMVLLPDCINSIEVP